MCKTIFKIKLINKSQCKVKENLLKLCKFELIPK